MIDFEKTIILCLGLGDLKPEDMVEQCLKYDTKESWTYGLPKEYILKKDKTREELTKRKTNDILVKEDGFEIEI